MQTYEVEARHAFTGILMALINEYQIQDVINVYVN